MFITGPDVIKTVTGEEVGLRGARRRDDAQHEVGRRAPRRRRRGPAASRTRATSCRFLPQNNLETPPRVAADRRPAAHGRGARHASSPTTRTSPTTCATSSAWSSTTASSSRSTSTSPRTSSAASRASTATRSASSATSPRSMAGVLDIDACAKAARFVRTCDAFNIPILTFCRRPRLPARHRAGVGRDHPPRREAALRLHRGDGPEDHGHHAQGLRRRLRRHGLQAPAGRLQLRLADRRGRGHGPRGRGEHHLPPRHRAARRRPTSAARSSWTTTRRASPTPTARPSAATSTTSSSRTRRARSSSPRCETLQTKREPGPKRKHGNIPL